MHNFINYWYCPNDEKTGVLPRNRITDGKECLHQSDSWWILMYYLSLLRSKTGSASFSFFSQFHYHQSARWLSRETMCPPHIDTTTPGEHDTLHRNINTTICPTEECLGMSKVNKKASQFAMQNTSLFTLAFQTNLSYMSDFIYKKTHKILRQLNVWKANAYGNEAGEMWGSYTHRLVQKIPPNKHHFIEYDCLLRMSLDPQKWSCLSKYCWIFSFLCHPF